MVIKLTADKRKQRLPRQDAGLLDFRCLLLWRFSVLEETYVSKSCPKEIKNRLMSRMMNSHIP